MSIALEGFRWHLEATESPRTVRAYMADAAEFRRFLTGGPASIDMVEAWVASLSRDQIRPQTIGRKLSGVRRWLGFLRRHGDTMAGETLDILRDYAVTRGPREADRKRIEPVTEAEYLEARGRVPTWGRALLGLLWWTGCRVSEAVGDRLAGIPHLTIRSGDELAGRGWTRTVGKGGRVRVLVLPSLGQSELAPWLDGRGPDEPLFQSPSDAWRPVTSSAVRQMLRRVGAGHPHRFRHAYKARLRYAAVREEVIRALMGHTPSGVTEQYGQVGIDEMLEAAERLGGIR